MWQSITQDEFRKLLEKEPVSRVWHQGENRAFAYGKIKDVGACVIHNFCMVHEEKYFKSAMTVHEFNTERNAGFNLEKKS